MFRGKVRTSRRDVHQHSLCCQSGSEKQGKGTDESRICRSPQVNGPSYHYYLTNHVRTQLSSTDIQKYYNIHSWLDNVVKNNKREPAVADFESDCVIEGEADSLQVGDDYTSSAHLDEWYPPHVACAKAKSPIKDQKETLSRQAKIKTLKVLLTKHERCTRKETRLKRQKVEPMRNMYCGFKALRKQHLGLPHENNNNPREYAGNYSNEQNIAGLVEISARD